MVAASDLAPVAAIVALPETRQLLVEGVSRLASNLPLWWGAPAGITNHTATIEALVREFVRAEFLVEVQAGGDRITGWAVAARLGEERCATWAAELAALGGSSSVEDAIDANRPRSAESAVGREGIEEDHPATSPEPGPGEAGSEDDTREAEGLEKSKFRGNEPAEGLAEPGEGSSSDAGAGPGEVSDSGEVAQAATAGAWALERAPGGGVRFEANGEWAMIGGGEGAWEALVQRVSAGAGEPKHDHVLWIEGSPERWARLMGWGEAKLGPLDQWPRWMEWSMTPRQGRFRTEARLDLAEAVAGPLEPWQVPTNLVRDPLVGFTAMHGADRWLSRLGLFSELGVTEWPKRLLLWSVAGFPWLQYFAAETANPANLLTELMPALPLRFMTNHAWQGQTFALRVTNRASRVEVMGLGYLAPFVEGRAESDPPLLVGGLFPAPPGGDPAPAELMRQVVGRTNLLMYDWEMTGLRWVESQTGAGGVTHKVTNHVGRLVQLKELAQLGIMLRHPPAQWPRNKEGFIQVAGGAWIDRAGPLLGDTITELVLETPTRVVLTRSSQLGLSALEWTQLLRWIHNPGFPGWQDPPAPPVRRGRPGQVSGLQSGGGLEARIP
ncbi:MAG: hypothetical protein KF833_11920 [Verrucomicrobiae bacterium]|nr:hypothetical protein [Verrucomicrobiae bacterium]